MNDEEKREFADMMANMIERDMEGLIYEEPKCDFEHISNMVVNSCIDCLELYKEDKFLELDLDKINEFEIVDGTDSTLDAVEEEK